MGRLLLLQGWTSTSSSWLWIPDNLLRGPLCTWRKWRHQQQVSVSMDVEVSEWMNEWMNANDWMSVQNLLLSNKICNSQRKMRKYSSSTLSTYMWLPLNLFPTLSALTSHLCCSHHLFLKSHLLLIKSFSSIVCLVRPPKTTGSPPPSGRPSAPTASAPVPTLDRLTDMTWTRSRSARPSWSWVENTKMTATPLHTTLLLSVVLVSEPSPKLNLNLDLNHPVARTENKGITFKNIGGNPHLISTYCTHKNILKMLYKQDNRTV